MTRIRCAALGLTLIVSALPAVAADAWSRVEGERFTLFTDAGASLGRDIVVRLERVNRVLQRMLGDPALSPHRPTYIYALNGRRAADRYISDALASGRTGGTYLGSRMANYLVLNVDESLDVLGLACHEYLHSLVASNAPGTPLWVNEGLAEMFGTFWASESLAEIGAPLQGYPELIAEVEPLPLEHLFRVRADSNIYRENPQKLLFHAWSWALVHYVMVGSGDPPEALLRDVFSGEPDAVRLGRAVTELQASPGRTWSRVRAHHARPEPAVFRVELDASSGRVDTRVRKMRREEVLYRQGDLLTHGKPQDLSAAEKRFRKALRLNPEHAPTVAAIGWLDSRAGRLDDAHRALARAVDLDPADARSRYLAGQNLLRMAERASAGSEARRSYVRAARHHLQAGIALRPDDVEPHIALGHTYILEQDAPPSAGVEALSTALRFAPWRDDAVYYLIVLELRRGERDAALTLLRERLARSEDPLWSRRAEEALFASEIRRVETALGSGREAEAERILADLRQATDLHELQRRLRLWSRGER